MRSDRMAAVVRELAKFGIVGGIGFVVDVSVFNILRVGLLAPAALHDGPVVAKLVSTTLAIAVNWAGNRLWTFRDRRGANIVREGVQFALASIAGLLISVACLWVSHYLLGLTSILDDNVSSNIIGLGLGTAVRFGLYRWWVFGTSQAAAPQQVDSGL
ncbi:putative flippase GtrA [Cryobacterium mesophilum]|uniref:GtrA family protein n=2 Tax=Terrimesophilobacter mesophilus TaxID=433647 RepID=A0A4V3I9C1_9MICO|nr:GtrA family protein [Terrimesophilobacter mesophilus]MBB5631970.1 putative flippase GtrA [Terrimesophilobacter mesophilus]TFB78868.1 GtrA family protein [Terrimesophilobacter mesophilus]